MLMTKYRIHYKFDGMGYVDIEAKNKEKAEELFCEGEFSDEVEEGDNSLIVETEKLKQ